MVEFPLAVTALYAGLNALIMMAIALQIPGHRRRTRIGLGLGDDVALRWRVRAHGNNAEYVPYALILIGILELAGEPSWLLHVLGVALTLGRVLHPIGLSISPGVTAWRVVGMVLTWAAILVGAVACLRLTLLG